MPVIGMGGYFFRAINPEALKEWYRKHLGVGGGCGTDENGASNPYCWYHEGGPMVFEPFVEASDHFPAEKQAMINLRVRDLKGLIRQLKNDGLDVIEKPEWEATEAGSFARIHDPEGNPVELWEPPAA
jgi:predicted enzyme related to lactoylglutathione lyase